MWGGRRSDYASHDTYRIRGSITVFEKVGFKIVGRGNRTILLSFSDKSRNLEDFMMPNDDGAVLARHITGILARINLPVAYFDFMYDSLS